MTAKELNSVRELNKIIRDLERHLQILLISEQNLTPVINGLPHATELKSRVEKIALKIVDDERELASLREQLPQEQSRLADIITREVSAPSLQTLLILRYVACLPFKEIARRMNFTLRHVFRLHKKILNVILQHKTKADIVMLEIHADNRFI